MNKTNNIFFAVFLVPLIFLILSLITISDYGVNWDEPIHFMRGQAYLYYFISGKTQYDSSFTSGSYFQNMSYSTEYLLKADSGHPPLNGILAALSNYIFHQKLGLLEDVEGYHFFNILSATLLVLVVSVFAYQAYGLFASIVAALSLSSYPLFFSETHFNIKDPPEAAFFGLSIWAFWLSLKKGSLKWILLSAVGAGFALGTKFNIVFLPFILIPYLAVRYLPVIWSRHFQILLLIKKVPKCYWLGILIFPLIILLIFYGTWPYLWQDPWENLLKIVRYYKDIGTGMNSQLRSFYLPFGINGYPLFWILTTTPPVVLFFTLVGAVAALLQKDKEKTGLLFLIWFFVVVARVSMPGSSIYGGVRQIMEYIPAMALLTGLGATFIYSKLGNKKIVYLLVLLAFLPHLLVMVNLHPNQNVYFNSLIGGLSGAKANNIPSWGNSYGNAYYQAIRWVNNSAEKGGRLALVQGTGQNVPPSQVRSDLYFNNQNWSGINRYGEYLIELTHQDAVQAYPSVWEYIETFLEPVYEVKVDGVAIAKVWKNDLEHTKSQFRKTEVKYEQAVEIKENNTTLNIRFSEKVELTRLYISSGRSSCRPPEGDVQTSLDGENWLTEKDRLPTEQVSEKNPVDALKFRYYFPAREVTAVRLLINNKDACILNKPKVELYILDKVK